jgi:hypothetical protein
METVDKFFYGFLGGLGFLWMRNYLNEKAKGISVRFTGVQFEKRDGLKLVFNLGLEVTNKNKFSIPDLVFNGGVYMKEQLISKIELPHKVTIPSQGKVHINFPLIVDYKTIVSLWSILPQMKKSMSLDDLRLKGDILMMDDAGGVVIGTSINESFRIEFNKLW